MNGTRNDQARSGRAAGARSRALAVVVVTSGVLALSACGPAAPELEPKAAGCEIPAGDMAFAIGGRANMPAVGEPAALVATVKAAAANEAHVTVLDTGSDPSVVWSKPLTLMAKNDLAKEREIQANVAGLGSELQGVRALSSEADPLDALTRAADAVRAGSGTGTVVLVDSALQTTGALDYAQEGMFAAEPTELGASLQAANQLPDLTGMTVFLIGVGDTAAPQEPLDAGTRALLRDQWQAIAEAGGATCVAVDPSPMTGAAVPGVPEVSPVPAPEFRFDVPAPGKPYLLREQLRFRDNSNEYADPATAREVLRPTAEWMADTGATITVTGTTASAGTSAGQKERSLGRAEAVKATLVELGANPSKITTKGVGIDDPHHVPDRDSNGKLIPAKAALNRLVIVSTP